MQNMRKENVPWAIKRCSTTRKCFLSVAYTHIPPARKLGPVTRPTLFEVPGSPNLVRTTIDNNGQRNMLIHVLFVYLSSSTQSYMVILNRSVTVLRICNDDEEHYLCVLLVPRCSTTRVGNGRSLAPGGVVKRTQGGGRDESSRR